jgi:ankyrin repeat protein
MTGCVSMTVSMIYTEKDRSLRDAAGAGDIAQVDRLLERGATIRNPYALEAAVLNRHYAMVRHLIGRGTDVSGGGRWPLRLPQSPLWYAVAHGDVQMAELLISLGADVDLQGKDGGGSPLHAAADARENRLALARLLLDHKANVNAMSSDALHREWCKATPLHMAVFSLDEAVVDLFIVHGADLFATDDKGLTPKQCAQERLKIIKTEESRPKIARLLALLEAAEAQSR